MTAERVLSLAYQRGIRIQGFSDHLFRAEDISKMLELREELQALPIPEEMDVYVGCEAQMLSTTVVTLPPDEADQLDYVIMATNHFHLSVVADPTDTSVRGWAYYALDMMAHAIDLGYVDVIPHPLTFESTKQITTPEAFETLQDQDLIAILSAAKQANVAMELNPAILVRFPDQMMRFFRLCLEVGVKLSPGSDAHSVDRIGYSHCRVQSQPLIDQLSLKPSDLWSPTTA